MKAPIPSEAECQRTILAAAKLAGWRCHAERTSRTASGGHATAIQGEPGFPDIVAVKGASLLFIELKRDRTGRMGPGQDEWIEALDNVAGVQSMVVYVPSDMDRLIRALQRPLL